MLLAGAVVSTLRLVAADPVDFNAQVKPILEFNCVSCHGEEKPKAKLAMLTRETLLKGGENGPALVAGDSAKSAMYKSVTLPADHDDVMPPVKKGGPLPKDKIEILRQWIDQGAKWPDGVKLVARKAEETPRGDEKSTVGSIHDHIAKTSTEKAAADMKAYKETISGTGVVFDMVSIPAGEFTMGSPDSEKGRGADEGPGVKVKISPFWMGKMEVTWAEYELFMRPEIELDLRKKNPSEDYVNKFSDAISRPTKPYVEMSFGMGKDGFPAISMTQHAANKYCEWISARTGHFYRLPTEAEWEYAYRAGTTTAYFFGDDPAQLGDYAWYGANSDWKYQKVGKKKPNPWGLNDIAGNVCEWTLDQYDADWFKKNSGKVLEDPWNVAVKAYPLAARGGSWDDEEPGRLRAATRRSSDKSWKIQDPQLPKSIWYLTDAQFMGFRVVRPLKVPDTDAMHKYWNNGVERD